MPTGDILDSRLIHERVALIHELGLACAVEIRGLDRGADEACWEPRVLLFRGADPARGPAEVQETALIERDVQVRLAGYDARDLRRARQPLALLCRPAVLDAA